MVVGVLYTTLCIWPEKRGGSGLIKGVALSGSGLIKGVALSGSGLIKGMALSGSGMIKGVAHGERPDKRGGPR